LDREASRSPDFSALNVVSRVAPFSKALLIWLLSVVFMGWCPSPLSLFQFSSRWLLDMLRAMRVVMAMMALAVQWRLIKKIELSRTLLELHLRT